MLLPLEIEKLIKSLPKESQLVVRAIALMCEVKTQKLDARIKELEDQLSKTSRNSSKPPSSDGFKKSSTKSLYKKTNLKKGGQRGHKGDNLKMTQSPDFVILHKVERCSQCQKDLSNTKIVDSLVRQVYDIPPMQIEITEHQAEVKQCSCGCLNTGVFPEGISHYVQYGPNIKAFMTYLQGYQLLPYQRSAELVQDLFGHKMSQGTLYNIQKHAFDRLEDFELDLELFLTSTNLAGFDETGLRVLTKLYWLHNSSTDKSVLYKVHAKRGSLAMDNIGVLPKFKGVAVHDFWKSYYQYQCDHALCNAHILRELIFIKERFSQDWAQDMINLLLKMKKAKERALLRNKESLSKATLRKYHKRYDKIIQQGLEVNPISNAPPRKGKRGRKPNTKPRNLVNRLDEYRNDITRFLDDFNVPFDNNFSERDLRMMKVKLKISGCFRSLNGAEFFARIRSYIATALKQKINAFDAIRSLFVDNDLPRKLIRNLYC